MEKYVKDEENAGKIKNCMETCNRNEIKLIKTDEKSNREGGGDTRAPERMRYENSKLNTDLTNDSTYSIYSCPSGKIENRMGPGNAHEIERMKKDVGLYEEEVGTTGEKQRQKCGKLKLNTDSTNDSIYSCPGGKIKNWMEPGDEHEIETMKKDVGLDGEMVGETGEQQRQKCGNPKLDTDLTNESICSIYSCTGGKIKNRMEPGDEHKNERLKKDVGSDREEGGATGEPQ